MPQFHVIRLTCPSPINWSLINTTLLQSTAIRNLEHHTNKQILVFPKQSHCEWLFLFSLSFLSFFYSAKHTAVTCWQWPLSWQSFCHAVTTDNSSAPEADDMHVFSFVFVQCSFAKGFFLLPRAYLLLPLLSAGWAWVWVIHCVLHMVLTARSSYSGSKALQTCLFCEKRCSSLACKVHVCSKAMPWSCKNRKSNLSTRWIRPTGSERGKGEGNPCSDHETHTPAAWRCSQSRVSGEVYSAGSGQGKQLCSCHHLHALAGRQIFCSLHSLHAFPLQGTPQPKQIQQQSVHLTCRALSIPAHSLPPH